MKLRGCSEGGLVHRSWGSDFWVQSMNFGLFRWSVALWVLVSVSLDWWRLCEGVEEVGLEWRGVWSGMGGSGRFGQKWVRRCLW